MTKYVLKIVSSLLLAMIVTQPAFSQESVLLQVYYGGYANECSWEIVNNLDGNIVLSGGSGLVDNSYSYNGNVSLYPGEYVFKAYDSAGDGWTLANGWYQITPSSGIATGQILFQNGYFQETDFTILSSSSIEIGMVGWLNPVSSATLTASENITVKIRNFGTSAVGNFTLSYSTNGGSSFVTETYNSSVNPGNYLEYTFTQTANFAVSGIYDCIAYVTATGDAVAFNDTVHSEVVSVSSISSFPWTEDFSTWPPANWSYGGGNDWASYSNSSAFCNFYYWQNGNAEMITPALNLYNPATLSFSWSSGYSYQAPNDELEVLISTDNGASWELIWKKTGIELYSNDGALDVSPGTFIQETVDLTAYENDVVNIKFNGVTGYGYNLYVDDVSVSLNPVIDLAVINWVYPDEYQCGLTSSENVTIQIKNVGASNVSNFNVSFSVDGGSNFITEIVSSVINPGDTIEYTFAASSDFSVLGEYYCEAQVSATGDFSTGNDVFSNFVSKHLGIISSFPYSEDFESGNSDWGYAANKFGEVSLNNYNSNYAIKLEGGSAVIWDANNINKPWAGSSTSTTLAQAWTENFLFHSSTHSCVIDATQLSSLELLFDLKQFYRTGPKYTWFRVLVDGVQIMSDQGIENFHPQTSYSDPFINHRFDLSSYAGTQFTLTFEGANKFNSFQYAPGNASYIDNIVIQELAPPDASIVSLISPVSGCSLTSSENVEVQVQNLGGASISNYDLSYSINAGAFVTNSIATVVESGNILNYIFPQTADLNSLGQYTFTIAVSLTGDIDNTNDTMSFIVDHSASVAVSISGLNATYCLYDQSSNLIGNPSGGVFSGSGIDGNVFNPFDAGLGTHDITYSYNDTTTGCSNVETQSVTVNGTEVSFSGLYNGPTLVPVLVQVYYNSNWPQEQSWEIVDVGGNIVLSSPAGTITYGYSYNDYLYLPFGEYSFIAHDSYGDGWNSSWYEITPDFGSGTGFTNYQVSLSLQPQNTQETVFIIGGTVEMCFSDPSVSLTGTPSGGTFSGDGITGNTFDPSLAGAGTHTITYTYTDGFGCVGFETQYIIIEASPNVDLGSDQLGCDGDVFILDAGSGASYLWSTGATSSTITVSQTGFYSVTATSTNGCESIDQVNIVINPLPTINLGPDQDNCVGDIVNLNAGVANAYLWSNGATTSSIDVSVQGTYSVTITSQFCDASDEVIINFHSVNVDLGNDVEICDGSSAVLDAGAGSFYSYLWSTGAQSQTIEVGSAGDYFVTVTDLYGCSDNDDINIVINSLPVVDLGPDFIIQDTVIILDPGVGYTSYLWSTGSVSMVLPVDGSVLQGGAHTYWVEVTNSNGCTQTDTIIITKNLIQTIQTVVLIEGWSMISTYIDPFDADVVNIFAPVVNNLLLVKDGEGNVYWPQFYFNGIGNFTIGRGYQTYMSVIDSIELVGTQLQPELTPFTIPLGWSIMAYLRTMPASIVTMLSGVVLNVELVKNGNGDVYWPLFNYNGIGNMVAGGGYQILTNSSFSFTYPANGTKFYSDISKQKQAVYFNKIQNTGHNMTLAIPKHTIEKIAKPNDEIGVFNSSGKLMGSGVYNEKDIIITIWGDDPYTDFMELDSNDESISLKMWRKQSNSISDIRITNFIEGSSNYKTNTYAIVGELYLSDQSNISITNYPNPFNTNTTIEFYISEDTELSILLYSSLGKYIREICCGNYSQGLHLVNFNRDELAKGVYYYILETQNNRITKKLCVE
ncbi:MAG: CARDB domain-containing protein [Bacteroidota bacterium]|nr:CARDB domain-containing protein [Bacteroidota bacterium]